MESRHALCALTEVNDSDLREVVELARAICESEAAAITVITEGVVHHLATSGFEPFVCDVRDSFCVHVLDADGCVVVEDATLDERFRSSPFVDGTAESIRFYASAPVHLPDGRMIGRLCVYDHAPRRLSPLQEQTLATLAASVSTVLALRLRQNADTQRAARDEAAEEEALRVAGQISHDMRIPLTALTASLEMLEESAPVDEDPLRARLFASARRSADRMLRMVDGLLRLNDVTRTANRVTVDLTRVAEQAVTDAHTVLAEADATVLVDRLPEAAVDEDQLYSVFLNLIGNAVKFARPEVPPVIRICSRPLDGGVRISVIDNGRGIPAEDRTRVFAMFSRLSSCVDGHGIGLATVQRIVEAHGGRVGIADAVDHGTEVWLDLPR